MKITFLTVGKNADKQIEELVSRYVSRLSHYVKFEHKCLPDVKLSKNDSTDRRKQLEGQNILAAIKESDHVVVLDERGNEPTSQQFAATIEKHLLQGTRDMVFVVGGPYGFSRPVYDRADRMMALSRMTLTHEMVRLFFVEQLYRAFTIINAENYHH